MKEKNVIDFYIICIRLKDTIRTGWTNWGVQKDRLESVAEHIYGTQMLAIAMWSEYKYDIDMTKVLTMLAVHELEETVIGDLTIFNTDAQTKKDMGHKAVTDILGKLSSGDTIKNLIFEFDERKTKEARFAYFCDKLEADLQCKIYDEQQCVDLSKHVSSEAREDGRVKQLLEEEGSWSGMWMKFGQERYGYDENFKSVSEYAKKHKITKK